MAMLIQLEARLEPSRIGFVKFIVEAYDGLAVLSTVDRRLGRILCRFYPSRRQELVELLLSLGVEVQL